MQGCTHLSRFALVSRVFPGRNAKKYTGYCIIACVLMWLRGKDSNQRPPGYEWESEISKYLKMFSNSFEKLRISWLSCEKNRTVLAAFQAFFPKVVPKMVNLRVFSKQDSWQPFMNTWWEYIHFQTPGAAYKEQTAKAVEVNEEKLSLSPSGENPKLSCSPISPRTRR